MTRVHKVTVSSWTLQAVGALAVVMGLAFITLRPLVILLPEDSRFTGLSPAQLKALDPQLFAWIGMVFRSWGVFAVGLGIMMVGLARNAYRRGERWAWWTLAVAGGVTFVGFLLVNFLLGSDFRWVIASLLVVYAAALWLGRPSR